MEYSSRLLERLMTETVMTRPLVYLDGMRQCGKSTLVQNLSVEKDLHYVTFDNPVSLSYAKNDPAGFIQHLSIDKLNIIDEVQLAPELFRYFKIAIDENRLTGKNSALYILTGSSNIFALPSLADALVGRMSILTLYPFSVSESKKTGVNFLEKLLASELVPAKYPPANIPGIISNATFPEIALNKKKDRYVWFNDYLTTILQRDVRTLADIKNPDNIFQLLVSLAQRAGGLLNNASIMQETGLDAKTYDKYKALCACTFLVFELPSWSKPNKLDKRFVKQKKLYFTDTNLLCHILQRDMEDLYKNDRTVMGRIFENFIACEIMKSAKSLGAFSVSHFNPVQNQGKEVDFVIESPNGKTIGIEVKLDGTINDKDSANMAVMQETIGNKFQKGVIIYTGTELMQVRKNIWAVPVSYLWKE
jgi:predicted AAA+ superfamily ATPase